MAARASGTNSVLLTFDADSSVSSALRVGVTVAADSERAARQ
jgi:hypothetical protein